MSYFVSRDELLWEINRAVDHIFSAVATCLSDEDKKFTRKFEELRNEFLLLINIVGRSESHQLKTGSNPVIKNRRKHMSERKFEEILKEMIDRILEGNDEKLIILVDELEKSADKLKKEKELITGKLTTIQEKVKTFLKQEQEEKIEKKEEKAD